jgi:heme-degrading monooxygenase HmoA
LILEVVRLKVSDYEFEEYVKALGQASTYLLRAKGYISHELQRCFEKKDEYLLLIHWETVDDHLVGFRESADYQEWRTLLHPFYQGPLIVEHFEKVTIA